jgi:hypothetical protein
VNGDYPQAPCLQTLVAHFGDYSSISPEAWTERDAAMAQWHRARRIYTVGHIIEEAPTKQKKKRRKTANQTMKQEN